MNTYLHKNSDTAITQVKTAAYTIPTSTPESDGTKEWRQTTMVLVELSAGGKTGLGYTYSNAAAWYMIEKSLKEIILSQDCLQIEKITQLLLHEIRNDGDCGVAMMAVSAINNALWDLKAKLFGMPLYKLLNAVHGQMAIYGSGGFTSYTNKQTQQQFERWASQGITSFKMKIGREPGKDEERVKQARNAIANNAALFVDANGAYTVKQALAEAEHFKKYNVSWFEEPVTSGNLAGLQFIRSHAPAQYNIAAGEYGYNLPYFKKMMDAGAVDILQADATRCGGISNFLKAGYLCEAYQLPFSSHCAPAIHLHAALALPSFYIAEYFHDHERIENMLFDGMAGPVNGFLQPDSNAPGLGITFKYKDAEKFKQ
ncbi:MAG TPA: enolase C-terminal domain-like protein [Chitinophagaceae bacterium]|nr:enolase C-terminal domain-like protein [Chitinophagaceae bacterium]